MAKIWVLAEHRNSKLKKSSFEILNRATAAGHEVTALLFTDPSEPTQNFIQELGDQGAKKVFHVSNAALKFYSAECYTRAFSEILKKEKPDYFLASHTPTGKDWLPHVSALCEAGLASDCVEVDFTKNPVTFRRPFYAGKATAEVEFLGSGVKLATVRPNALGMKKPAPSKAEVVTFSGDFGNLKSKVVDVIQGTTTRPDVTEAAIVISGGRSLKNAENFKMLEELADILGAGVGASRAAVDAGYRPHRDQVGQTGKVVSPQLYIALGISGAIQHLAGMRTSKVVVAINSDSEAPIFQIADYGIVGDLFTLLPLLKDEFKKLKESTV